MKRVIIALILAIMALSADSGDYTKLIHNTDPQAKCLDGSSPMIYLHQGGDTKNILFHLLGGGVCAGQDLQSTLENCYQRSKGQFGSSKPWPETFPGKEAGVLSTDPSRNVFANWTKIVMVYCDGSFHQGNNKNPVKYKDANLYFRGAVNTRSHFKWTDNKYNLSAAQKIVLTGSSAGGIAVYLWHQYLRDLVPHPERVYSVADSSIFYNPLITMYSPEKAMQYLKQIAEKKELSFQTENDDPNPTQILMQLSNVDQRPPNKECSSLLSQQEQWKCIFIQFSYPTLQSPILFVESSYDQFIIQVFLKIKCLQPGISGFTLKNCSDFQQNAIQIYRDLYIQRFLPNLLKYGHSIWTISCSWHAKLFESTFYDSDLQKVPKQQGRTMRNATEAFVFDNKRIIEVDLFGWPANTPCAY